MNGQPSGLEPPELASPVTVVPTARPARWDAPV